MSELREEFVGWWREREMDLLRKLGSYEAGAEALIEKQDDAVDAAAGLLRSQMDAGLAVERKDCEKALVALAGVHYTTPAEGYGTNSSWAISDLCRAVIEVRDAAVKAERERSLLEACYATCRYCDLNNRDGHEHGKYPLDPTGCYHVSDQLTMASLPWGSVHCPANRIGQMLAAIRKGEKP